MLHLWKVYLVRTRENKAMLFIWLQHTHTHKLYDIYSIYINKQLYHTRPLDSKTKGLFL